LGKRDPPFSPCKLYLRSRLVRMRACEEQRNRVRNGFWFCNPPPKR
jgi:hypothetical protein